MRASTARLTNSPVRLADIMFPQVHRLVARTRLAFIHLDNVLSFAKRDRDGRVDGYLAAYLPDEVVLVFLRKGEAANAASMHTGGRAVITIGEALKRMRSEAERGQLTYCAAPLEQLAWMYQGCAVPLTTRFVDAQRPEALFPVLLEEKVTGVLELIANGRVNYLRLDQGKFKNGYFSDKPDSQPVPRFIESLFQVGPTGAPPLMAACVFPPVDDLPAQAPAALVATYRELYWRIVEAVEQEFPADARRRAQTALTVLRPTHQALALLGVPRTNDIPDAVVGPDHLATALTEWTRHFLEPVEVMMPGTAPKVLTAATREHRYVLQAAGYYQSLPWSVSW